FGNMVDFAKKDPGAFAGAIANAVVADPELLFLPQMNVERTLKQQPSIMITVSLQKLLCQAFQT
ncbi:MAG: hypothetical protein EBS86_04315, partial [Crocinitomicaceae bacterium]|nr:hypothetical protein [Crocinitomicaceae bacterium]